MSEPKLFSLLPLCKAAEESSLNNKHAAIGAFNVNFYSQAVGILKGLKKANAPAIIQASSGANKFQGGPDKIAYMVKKAMTNLKHNLPVCLHLDHGTAEAAKDCINGGFSSVMIDASHLEVFENISEEREPEEKQEVKPVIKPLKQEVVEKEIVEEYVQDEVYEIPEEKQIYNGPKKIQVEKESFLEPPSEKKPSFSKSFNDSVIYLKYAGIFILILIIGFGIYYFAKTIFFDKSDNVEIVRQSPQEEDENVTKTTIDSLKTAKEQEEAELKSRISLKISAKEDGRVIVATDEKITKETELVELSKGQEREWKAKEFFYLRTLNTNAFKVTVNGKQVRFRLKDTRNARIEWVDDKPEVKD